MINPISNHQKQRLLYECDTRFLLASCGRRFGKTFVLKWKFAKLLDQKRKLSWYVAPTRGHAKELMWDDLKDLIRTLKWKCKINETELTITRLKTKSKVVLKSAEKYNRLRGKGLDFVGFDEFADIKKEAWTEAIRPALSDKLGEAWFLGTPKGYNHFYEMYQEGKTKPNWSCYQFKTIDSPFFQTEEGKQELIEARNDLDERTFRQEYEASFESFSGRIIESFDRAIHHSVVTYNESLPVIIGMDFNRSPMTAVVCQEVSGRLIAVDEIVLMTSNTEEMCREISRRYPKSKVYVRPDSTGARHTSNSSQSDHEIIRSFGFEIQLKGKNPARVDRWASVNRAFERSNVLVNINKCKKLTKELETLGYKEGTCEINLPTKLDGHLFDAFGYAVYHDYAIIKTYRSKITVSKY